MVLEIAFGIVLGFVLLALLPIVVYGSVVALRWLIPAIVLAAVVLLILEYATKVIGTALVITLAFSLFVAWALIPQGLANSDAAIARHLVAFHSAFEAALNNEPPYQGVRRLPIRLLALGTAVTVTIIVIISALIAIGEVLCLEI